MTPMPTETPDPEIEEKLNDCGLTPEQQEKWSSTCSMMVWTCPGFAHLWYKLLHNHNGDYTAIMTKGIGNAATDGKNIMVNPDWFFKYSLPERTFVMAHEIIHNVYGDIDLLHRCKTSGFVPMNDGSKPLPFRNDLMQKSMDYRINALLIKAKIGKPPKDCGNYDKDMDGSESVLDVYQKVYEAEKDTPEGGGPGKGGFDNIMRPGKSTGQSPQSAARNPQQWAVETAAAQIIESQKAQGKMAGALKRMFEKLLEPEVDWRNHIATLINRISGSGGWNWKCPDEWWAPHEFFSPRRSGKGAGWIVMWGDTSGSRGQDEIASNMAELAGILEDVNPARLTVLWCDAQIHHIDELNAAADLGAIQARGVGGGGGTDQEPCFDWIAKQPDQPDLYIGFTDGYVSFPNRPPAFPVIWASSTDRPYPWGQVVRVNKRPTQP